MHRSAQKTRACVIWSHLAWIHPPAKSSIICGTSDTLFNLSELQFSPLKNGDNLTTSQDGSEEKVLTPQGLSASTSSCQWPPVLLVYHTHTLLCGLGWWQCVRAHVVTTHNFSWGSVVRGLPGRGQVLDWSPIAKLTNLQDPFPSPLPVQAQKSGSGGSTQAAEDLLLLGKPLIDLVSLLIPLVRAHAPARAPLGSLLRVK